MLARAWFQSVGNHLRGSWTCTKWYNVKFRYSVMCGALRHFFGLIEQMIRLAAESSSYSGPGLKLYNGKSTQSKKAIPLNVERDT